MPTKRNVSVEIPATLLDQVDTRAAIASRTRNEEVRYLLATSQRVLGMTDAVVRDFKASEKVRTVFYLELDQIAWIRERTAVTYRKVGPEIVQLLAFALKHIAERDLEIIERMVLGGRPAPAAQETASA